MTDYYFDGRMTWELRATWLMWPSLLFMLLPYVLLVLALGPDGLAELVGAVTAWKRPSPSASWWERTAWWVFGMPILVILDVWVHLRHLWWDPYDSKVFNYIKLRHLAEMAENSTQLIMKVAIFVAEHNPCAQARLLNVDRFTVISNIASSAYALLDNYQFLDKFSKLQSHGSKRAFLERMAKLGAGLAPASLLWAIEKAAQVDLKDYDLKDLSSAGFDSIGRAVRGSPCLRDLTLHGAVLRKMAALHLSLAVNPVDDMTSGRLRHLVIVVGDDDEDWACGRAGVAVACGGCGCRACASGRCAVVGLAWREWGSAAGPGRRGRRVLGSGARGGQGRHAVRRRRGTWPPDPGVHRDAGRPGSEALGAQEPHGDHRRGCPPA